MKLFVLLLLMSVSAFADHTFKEIDTCYHWNEKWQLDHKIQYANDNNGDLYFHNGGVIYCWRTPMGAQSAWEDHGDYLIRIKFKPGTKIVHMTRQYSIQNTSQYGDVIYSNDNRWHEYTITPNAVESWSAYQPNMIAELEADLSYHQDGKAYDDNVFYPWSNYSLSWINSVIPSVIQTHKDMTDEAVIFGENLDQHFVTRHPMEYRDYLNEDDLEVFVPKRPTKIKII